MTVATATGRLGLASQFTLCMGLAIVFGSIHAWTGLRPGPWNIVWMVGTPAVLALAANRGTVRKAIVTPILVTVFNVTMRVFVTAVWGGY